MADAPGMNYVEMNLGNVADGELEAQFNEELQKIMDVRAHLEAYKLKGKIVACSIRLDVDFFFDLETGATVVETAANFRPPKRKTVARSAFMRDGITYVEDAVQMTLPDNVRDIAQEGTNDNGE